jgi:hypothetical protein
MASPNETVIDNGMIGLSEKVMPSMRRKTAMMRLIMMRYKLDIMI